ncbi:hypothetical protein XAPC_2774 [Xanthomonas citri pv. punicae str. LMG 859]|nr:hypothetical protein XAPC_2774 [Xanthomonas citri pv. punicae str. LMG 859]
MPKPRRFPGAGGVEMKKPPQPLRCGGGGASSATGRARGSAAPGYARYVVSGVGVQQSTLA